MMQITAQLFGELKKYSNSPGEKSWAGSLPEGSTITSLMDAIGFPGERVRLVLVNDRLAGLETVLEDSDEVSFLTLLGGG
jgi:molybdopterin converting factor small subunit